MALTSRQTRLYTDTVSVFKPRTPASTALDDNDRESLNYPLTPTAATVYCFRQTAAEFLKGKFIGRVNKEDTQSLMDVIHFDQAQDVDSNYVLKITTPSDPDLDTFFIVMGNAMVKNYRANKKVFWIKRITKPPMSDL